MTNLVTDYKQEKNKIKKKFFIIELLQKDPCKKIDGDHQDKIFKTMVLQRKDDINQLVVIITIMLNQKLYLAG